MYFVDGNVVHIRAAALYGDDLIAGIFALEPPAVFHVSCQRLTLSSQAEVDTLLKSQRRPSLDV